MEKTGPNHSSMYAASREFYRMQKPHIVAARYVRNSDPSKKDTEVQKAQAEALAEYAKQMNYECPDTLLYADAISALKHPYWERPDLMRLWDDAERGMFDVVLVTEFFRVARTTAEQYAVIEYLKRFKVKLISITEKFEDTQEGQLMFMLQGWLGSVEAEKIRIRTIRGKQHRASKALTGQGAGPVYGYVYVDGEEYKKQRYVLNLEVIAIVDGEEWTEVKVVIYCFDCCLKGMSCRQIAFNLTRMGIPTQREREVWDRTTVRQILKREAYTGTGYNGLWTRDPETNKLSDKHIVKLPDGIYPQIITHDVWEQAQRQLTLNAEMSPRNNKQPQDTLLRGMMFCGICGRRLYVRRFTKPRPGRKYIDPAEYRCYTNRGIDDTLYHHFISFPVHTADDRAWEFAVGYIRNPRLIRDHIMTMRQLVVQRDHSQDLERDVERIKKSIANLYRLAEAADPDDDDGMAALQERLVALEREKREKEKLLSGVVSIQEKQEKLLTALDRFEAWAATVRPFLDDPTYTISQEDKINALLILGVKATLWPSSEEYPERFKLTLMPPDVARFCDFDFP